MSSSRASVRTSASGQAIRYDARPRAQACGGVVGRDADARPRTAPRRARRTGPGSGAVGGDCPRLARRRCRPRSARRRAAAARPCSGRAHPRRSAAAATVRAARPALRAREAGARPMPRSIVERPAGRRRPDVRPVGACERRAAPGGRPRRSTTSPRARSPPASARLARAAIGAACPSRWVRLRTPAA